MGDFRYKIFTPTSCFKVGDRINIHGDGIHGVVKIINKTSMYVTACNFYGRIMFILGDLYYGFLALIRKILSRL